MLPVHMDISECIKKSQEGIYLLSGLLKIDLQGAMEPLLNKILEFLLVKLSPQTSYLPYNFTVFILFSDVIAEVMKRPIRNEPTQWFPEGENGPFVNAGLERWTKSVMEWRAEETGRTVLVEILLRCRIRKIKVESIDDLVDIISNNSISSCLLPEPVNLDEVSLFLWFDL